MSQDPVPVTVSILGKEYRVSCQPHEQEGLMDSARMLDARMRGIREGGRVVGTERIAVIAALNIAHELIQFQRTGSAPEDDTRQRLSELQDRVADALGMQRQLDATSESV